MHIDWVNCKHKGASSNFFVNFFWQEKKIVFQILIYYCYYYYYILLVDQHFYLYEKIIVAIKKDFNFKWDETWRYLLNLALWVIIVRQMKILGKSPNGTSLQATLLIQMWALGTPSFLWHVGPIHILLKCFSDHQRLSCGDN